MKKQKMYKVIGRNGGFFAITKSKWKAREIRDRCFNIGKKEPIEVWVEITEVENPF